MALSIVNEFFILLGGISVFMLGLTAISDNMNDLAGKKTKRLLSECSSSAVRGIITGTAATAVAQSSIAVNVVVIGFTETGLLSLYSACGIVMGANIGTTVTAQIISLSGVSAFDITAVGSLAAFGGMILKAVSKNSVLKAVGRVMTGFGLIFIGLEIMSGCIDFFKEFTWFKKIFLIDNPLVLVLNGIVLTAIMQSSSAVTSCMVVLAAGGLLSFKNSIFLILGANIGTCFPVILSAFGKSEAARRVAVFNLLFNVFGGVLFFIPMLFFGDKIAALFTAMGSIGRAIANFHTVFNVLVTLITLPILKFFVKIVSYIVKDGKNLKKKSTFKYI